jgi:hypothetical protein
VALSERAALAQRCTKRRFELGCRRSQTLATKCLATTTGRRPWRVGAHATVRAFPDYGVVVDSVNVRVLLYVPVRSASVAPMC